MKNYSPKIPDSVAKAMAEADMIQRSIPPEVLKLNEMLQSIPPEVLELESLINSQIPSELSKFQHIATEQFASYSPSKIKELKDEYADELRETAISLNDTVKAVNNTISSKNNSSSDSADEDEYVSIENKNIESQCSKAENLINKFINSVGGKLQNFWNKFNIPPSNLLQRLGCIASIISLILAILK